MKRLVLLIPIILLAISFANAYNGFCFKLNLNGNLTNSWDKNPVDGTIYIKTENSGDYCLIFGGEEFQVRTTNGSFEFSKLIASPNERCKLDIEIYSGGFVKYQGEIWINENQTNYTRTFELVPNLKINVKTVSGKPIEGTIYVNGRKYNLINGIVEVPNTKDMVWVYSNISGFEVFDKFFNVEPSSITQSEINITLYRIPNPSVKFTQSLDKTNLGQQFTVEAYFINPDKESAQVDINGNISGCGIIKTFSFELNGGETKTFNYGVSPNSVGNCTIEMNYAITCNNKIIKKGTLKLTHYVSNKYEIKYNIENGTIIAEVFDINGNPVNTTVEIVYNGTKIELKRGPDGKYYGRIPGNEFKILASDGKNNGTILISGNFVKTQEENVKDFLFGWAIIGVLSAVTVGWIYYSRRLK